MANGIRSGAYRVGSLAAGSGLLILSDWLGWRPALVGIGVLLVALVVTILVFGPFGCPARPRPWPLGALPRSPGCAPTLSSPFQGLARWWDSAKGFITQVFTGLARHPHLGVIIVFVLIYKAGDALMGIMVIPFWKAQHFTNTEIGVVSGILGSVATTLGGFLGGWFTSRYGIGRGLLVLGIFQAVSNLGYWVAALPGLGRYAVFTLHLPFWDQSFAIYPIYLASQGESFSSGLGYAPFHGLYDEPVRQTLQRHPVCVLCVPGGVERQIDGIFGRLRGEIPGIRRLLLRDLPGVPACLCSPPLDPARGAKDRGEIMIGEE